MSSNETIHNGEFIIPGLIKMEFGKHVVIRNNGVEVIALVITNDNNYAVFDGNYYDNRGTIEVNPAPDNWDSLDHHVDFVDRILHRRWDSLSKSESKAVWMFLEEEFLKI